MVPITWDEAFAYTAERLRTIRARDDRDAIATYLGNPTVHNYGLLFYVPFLLRTLRSRNRYSATSVDQLPHHLAAWAMFGHQMLIPIPDIDHTDFFLIMGANPAASNGSLMTAPNIRKRLQGVRDRGGRVVLVDPRRTETARWADEHVFIRPGTDALFVAALIHTVI